MFRVPKATVTICDGTIASRELIANKNPTSNVLFSIVNPFFFFCHAKVKSISLSLFLDHDRGTFSFYEHYVKKSTKTTITDF